MSRIAMDTRAQNTLKELIEKEASTRIQCKIKQAKDKDDDEWFVRSKYTQGQRQLSHSALGESSRANGPIKDIVFPPRPPKQDPAGQIAELTRQLRESGNTNLLSDMRTPDEKQMKMLYDGFTKEEKGRYQYLKSRKTENPEDKYEYPLLSSFQYGWKLKEIAMDYKTPANGRTKIVEESFYRRNGVF